jgi:hypothetical protein
MRVALIGLTVALILACGGGSKVPKPFVEREGQAEVRGDALPTEITDQQVEIPTRTEIAPEGPASGVPVLEDYIGLFEAGDVVCPEGTDRSEDGKTPKTVVCMLPDGRRHGPYMSYHRGGGVAEVGTYVDGLRHGKVTSWTQTGRKVSVYTWVAGQPAGGEFFN